MDSLFKGILDLIAQFGIAQGIFIIIVLGMLYYLYQRNNNLYQDILQTKNDEIRRLAEENKEYRNMFQSLLKKDLSIKNEELELKPLEKKELRK